MHGVKFILLWIGWVSVAYACVVPIIKPLEAIFASLLLLLSFSMYWKEKKLDKSVNTYGLIILLYFGVTIISTALQCTMADTLLFAVKNSTVFLGFFIANYVRDNKQINLSVVCYCLSIFIIAVIAIVQNVWFGVERPPTMMSSLHAGYIIDYAFLILFVYTMYSGSHRRLLAFSCAGILALALLVMASRGAWFAAFIPMCILFCFLKNKRKYLLVMIAGVFLSLLLPSVRLKCMDTYKDIASYSYGNPIETSIGTRFDMWWASIEMFKKAPLWGIGPGNWEKEMHAMIDNNQASKVLTRFNQPHNMYIASLTTTGVIGLSSLCLLVCFPIYFALQQGLGRSFFTDALFVISIAAVFQGLTDSVILMYRPYHSYLFLVGVLMAGILNNNRESRTKNTPRN